MAKLFFCISEKLEKIEGGPVLIGVIIESDCTLETGENPNASALLRAREAIALAINIAIEHLYGRPVHIPYEGESLDAGMTIAKNKLENPFSQITEIED